MGSGGQRKSPGREVQRVAVGPSYTVGARPTRWGLDSFCHPVEITPAVTGMLYKQNVLWLSFKGLANRMPKQKEFALVLMVWFFFGQNTICLS